MSVVPAATAISDLATPGQADEDVVAMAFDPELATPHAEVISDEILQPPNPTFAENLEMSPPAADVWRERGEPLASAVSDTDEQPGQGWDEPARNQTEIASEGRIWEPQRELAAPQHAWLMPKSERQGAGGPWYQIRLGTSRQSPSHWTKRSTNFGGRNSCTSGCRILASPFTTS